MLLTGLEVLKQVNEGRIVIDPFDPKHLSTNSYDVTLSPNLLVYDIPPGGMLDMKQNNPTKSLTIPESGLVLEPDTLYLGSTNETATSDTFVPMFEGRSSIGRLGIHTHVTAGFGDIGWGYALDENGKSYCTMPTWTLEIVVVHRIRIYPHVRIGQVYFFDPKGEVKMYWGKYSAQKLPQASMLYKDFER